MDLFLSHFVNRFDAKGRISAPASFRAVLARDGFDGLFVQPALDSPALDCGGKSAGQGDRRAARLAAALLARARGLGDGAVWRERGSAPRFGRALPARRPLPRCSGIERRSRLCRLRPQVSNLGAVTLCRASRGGQGSRAAVASGTRRQGEGERGMKAGRGEERNAAGGLARHVPVLLAETLSALAPRPGGVIVDGTFGAGGYSRALVESGARVVAIDRDPAAIAGGAELVAEFSGRLTLVEGRFAELDAIARALRFRRRRRRRARRRRFVDAARRGRARLLASSRCAARHAHGG